MFLVQFFLGSVTMILLYVLAFNAFKQIVSGEKYRFPPWGVIPFLSLLLFFASLGLFFVGPNQVGVVVSPRYPGGVGETPLPPGLYFLYPLVDSVHTYSLANHTISMEGDGAIDACARDGRRVYVDASVIYALDSSQIVEIHRRWRKRYETELIVPITKGIVREVMSRYQAREMAQGEIAQRIEEELSAQLSEHGILIVKFVLHGVRLEPECIRTGD